VLSDLAFREQRIAKRCKNLSTLRGNAAVDEAERLVGMCVPPCRSLRRSRITHKVRSSPSLRPRCKDTVSAHLPPCCPHGRRSIHSPTAATQASRPELVLTAQPGNFQTSTRGCSVASATGGPGMAPACHRDPLRPYGGVRRRPRRNRCARQHAAGWRELQPAEEPAPDPSGM